MLYFHEENAKALIICLCWRFAHVLLTQRRLSILGCLLTAAIGFLSNNPPFTFIDLPIWTHETEPLGPMISFLLSHAQKHQG